MNITLPDPSSLDYGYQLSVIAAKIVFGGKGYSEKQRPNGTPMWILETDDAIRLRHVPYEPDNSSSFFRPDVDSRHTSELINYALDYAGSLAISVNYRPQYITRQLPAQPNEPIHPRPQVRLWHSIYITAPRKSDETLTGKLFEHIDRCKELSDTIATLKLLEWLMAQSPPK